VEVGADYHRGFAFGGGILFVRLSGFLVFS
jgi:hypothetical protein